MFTVFKKYIYCAVLMAESISTKKVLLTGVIIKIFNLEFGNL